MLACSTNHTTENIFHPNQIIASKSIQTEFTNKNYVKLQAQMQSGKTACSLLTAFDMILSGTVNNCFIFSGMSDTYLKSQWIREIKNLTKEYLSQNSINDPDLSLTYKKLYQNVYFNRDLQKIKDISQISNSILLFDEIHYGSTAGGSLHKLFNRLGLQNILEGYECPELVINNIFILSITATRANEDAIYHNTEEAQNNWGRVYMEPGDNYKSIMDYFYENRIYPNISFENINKNKIITLFNKYKHMPKYFIIRAILKQRSYLISILNELNIPYITFDQDTPKTKPFYNIKPSLFTVVLIRGKLRLGNQLNKTHICGVFESSSKMNNDALLQALPGRVCGYNVNEPIDIYVPNTFTECISEYEEVSKHNPNFGLTNTKFMKRRHNDSSYPEELKKNCMHNTDISKSSILLLQNKQAIENLILRNWRKSQNLWRESIKQKKELPYKEYTTLCNNHMNQALDKINFTRRYAIYKLCDRFLDSDTNYYIAGNILKYVNEDINLYKQNNIEDSNKYITENSHWLGYPISQ